MEKKPTSLRVVAAAIRDDRGRLLLQERPAHKHHGGQWEFPGGKVETGESRRAALFREIAEELGLMLEEQAMSPAGSAAREPSETAPGIVLFLYNCPVWQGEPEGREGQRWGWFDAAEAARLDMPPLDRVLLAGLES